MLAAQLQRSIQAGVVAARRQLVCILYDYRGDSSIVLPRFGGEVQSEGHNRAEDVNASQARDLGIVDAQRVIQYD